MIEITSRTNAQIKEICELHTAKGRAEHKRFIAEGTRACSTLIKSGIKFDALYTTFDAQHDAFSIAPRSRCILISDHVMERISTAKTPSGILGVFHMPIHPTPADLKAGIVLACIADPGNMGTLIRSATAMGVKSVVIIEGAEPWSPKVVQASAGTLGSVKIFQWTWEQLIANRGNFTLCALVSRDGQSPAHIPKNSLIIVGNEAHGIHSAWVADCDLSVTLTMPGVAESLNAAIAGSIALYLIHAPQ